MLRSILELVRNHTGHDFSAYKPATLQRRIARRMALQRIDEFEEYRRRLETSQQEVELLYRALLIDVTGFFRNGDAFDTLARTALPALLASKQRDTTLRVWVPGCSTGEEAYSLAIVLREALEQLQRPFETRIFATDVDLSALDTARAGLYPKGIVDDISAERLAKHFTREGDRYRIHEEIRETVVFARHDLNRDPPFIELDLLSCRNLLMYLSAKQQERLLHLFHYALMPGGLLFLGSSEGIASVSALYEVVDKKWRLYRRNEGPGPAPGTEPRSGAGTDTRFDVATAASPSALHRAPDFGATPARDEAHGASAPKSRLDDELAVVQEQLRSSIEQRQTSNEELYTMNEELQSSNEELQSMNEELEIATQETRAANDGLQAANEKLTRAEALFRAVLEAAPDAMLLIDEKGEISLVNTQAETIFGYTREELIGKRVETLVPKHLRARHVRQRETYAADAKTRPMGSGLKLSAVRNDGSTVPVDICLSTFHLNERRQIIAAVRDVTERKRSESALKTREREFRMIADNVPAAYCYLDSGGRYRFVNKEYESWAGLSRNNVIGKHYRGVLGDGVYDRIKHFVNRALAGETVTHEQSLPHPNGGRRPVQATYIPDNVDGEVKGFFALIVDVSQLKEAEEALRRAERLASVGTLAAGIAHEINNPLASILAAAQYALAIGREPRDAERAEQALHDIVSAAKRGGRIVKGVLQFTRDEPSVKSLNDLGALLVRARHMTADRVAERGAVVELAVADALPLLELNATEIEQVFVNLIHNAVEAGQEGVHVWLEATPREPGVRVVVRDDGPGMDAEQRSHVFEPFYTTRQIEGGTGLGLSIVHGIVTDHGGRIDVRSQPGSGTSFIIDLPIPLKKGSEPFILLGTPSVDDVR